MNDQDLDEALAGFRDDVPEMSEGAFLLGKLRLEEATTPQSKPVPELAPLQVRREIVGAKRRRSPPRRITPWLTAAAAVAIVAVGTTVALNSDGQAPATEEVPVAQTPPKPTPKQPVAYPPAPPRPPAETDSRLSGVPLPPAAQVYNAAGELAEHVSDLPQKDDQYLYMAKREWGKPFQVAGRGDATSTTAGKFEGYWDEWVPRDRSGVWQVSRDVNTGVRNGPMPDEGKLPSLVSGLSKQEGTFQARGGDYFQPHHGWLLPTEGFIAGLPRDPKALYQQLAKDSAFGYDPQATALYLAGELLSRPVPADLRRALFQALSYHPWLVISENVKTRDGRPAVSLRAEDWFVEKTEEILIDPVNGRLIGTRSVWLTGDQDHKPGDVLDETTVHWSVVNKIGATS